MKNLILLIALATLSFKASSQTVTTPSNRVTDTTVVVLPNSVARQVIKDLIAYDAAKQELTILESIVTEKDSLILTYVHVIANKDTQLTNLQSATDFVNQQLEVQYNLSKDLEQALKKEKVKNKILKLGNFGSIAAGVAIGYFVLQR